MTKKKQNDLLVRDKSKLSGMQQPRESKKELLVKKKNNRNRKKRKSVSSARLMKKQDANEKKLRGKLVSKKPNNTMTMTQQRHPTIQAMRMQPSKKHWRELLGNEMKQHAKPQPRRLKMTPKPNERELRENKPWRTRQRPPLLTHHLQQA